MVEEARLHKAERNLNVQLDPEGRHSKRSIKEQREVGGGALKWMGADGRHGALGCRPPSHDPRASLPFA